MPVLDATSVQSESDISGNARPAQGRYHMAINHAEEKGSKKKGTPGLDLEFQVICDGLGADGQPTSGQSGRTIPLFLSYIGGDDAKTKTCLNRVLRLALSCGILRPGESKEPDWQDAIGRELIVEVAEEKYDDQNGNEKVGTAVSFLGFWSLGNKEVANVPKDNTTPGMQQLAKSGNTPPNRSAAAATTTATTAATSTRKTLADL